MIYCCNVLWYWCIVLVLQYSGHVVPSPKVKSVPRQRWNLVNLIFMVDQRSRDLFTTQGPHWVKEIKVRMSWELNFYCCYNITNIFNKCRCSKQLSSTFNLAAGHKLSRYWGNFTDFSISAAKLSFSISVASILINQFSPFNLLLTP